MKTIYYSFAFLFALMLLSACKDPYMPELKNIKGEILVVEGYIDGARGTNVTMTRVKSLGQPDTSFRKYVADATVVIEDDKGNKFPLSNVGSGNYSGNYNLNKDNKYRLEIVTSDQKKYASDFVNYKISPPINAITYKIENAGARFYVNTQDDNNQSKFYRWKFEETWQYHSFYSTDLKYDPVKQRVIPNPESNFYCWQSDLSKDILIQTTSNLNQDVIKDMPINFIPNGSYKLSDLYSINVMQYVLDSIGFNYYQQLKKNTEETGSIFDPQPGNLRGNIKNSNDPSEIVVGYIGAGSSYQVRQFFKIPWVFREDCLETIFVPNISDSLEFYFGINDFWPLDYEAAGNRYKSSPRECADCTVRGSNIKPPFWP
ncbi:MAG: DUF4249 domain-containing protein [Ginsengibacter sp.]